MEEVPDRN